MLFGQLPTTRLSVEAFFDFCESFGSICSSGREKNQYSSLCQRCETRNRSTAPKFCDNFEFCCNCRPSCLASRWSRSLRSQISLDSSVKRPRCSRCQGRYSMGAWVSRKNFRSPSSWSLTMCSGFWMAYVPKAKKLTKGQKKHLKSEKSRKGLEKRAVILSSRTELDLSGKWKKKNWKNTVQHRCCLHLAGKKRKWADECCESVAELWDASLLRWIRAGQALGCRHE